MTKSRLIVIAVLLGVASVAPGAPTARLRTREISAPAAQVALPPGDPATLVVVARGVLTPEVTSAVRATGARVVAYLPDNGLLVRVARERSLGLLGGEWRVEGVAFTAAYLPGDKLAPELAAAMDARAGGPLPVHVLVAPDVSAVALANELRERGFDITGAADGGPFNDLGILLPAGDLSRAELLAEHPAIIWIEPRARRVLLNDTSIWVGQSGTAGSMTTPVFANGVFGTGQTVAVLDTGLDFDMCYFRDSAGPPVVNQGLGTLFDSSRRKVVAYDMLWSADSPTDPRDYDNQGHGTHVAGTVLGDNDFNLIAHDAADGMAPGAKLVVQDGGYAVDDCSDLPALGCPLVDLTPIFDQAYQQGARYHSNSWGDRENFDPQNTYTAACVDVDDFMYRHPDFLIVFAAGNGGPGNDTVGSPSTAKDAISVGATQRGTAAGSIAGFSSRGDTADGRIRPTVTAPGQGIVSAGNDGDVGTNNCGTANSSGTSMACPTVVGLAALVGEYYAAGFYPTAERTPVDGFAASAALIKATLMNSGQEMSNEPAIPSRSAGWGRVTLDETLAFRGDDRDLFVVDDRVGFTPGATTPHSFNVDVRSASMSLKATLVWTDPPSTPMAAINLENDLDLTISGPSGTFLGNVFAGGVSVTGGAADPLNPEEQVLIAAPLPGIYTITISPRNVPLNPQPYALVVSGDLPTPLLINMEGSTLAQEQNANGWPDPGEVVRLAITLRNQSDEVATSVSARLVALNSDVTVTDDFAAWPDVAPDLSETSLADHFELNIASATPCGARVPLRLMITANGKNFTADFSLPLGGLGLVWSERFDTTPEGMRPADWTLTTSRPAFGAVRADASVMPGGSPGPISLPHALFIGTDATDTVVTRTEAAHQFNLAPYVGQSVVLSLRWWVSDAEDNERLVGAVSDKGPGIYEWEILRTPTPFDSATNGGGLWGYASVDLSTLPGFNLAGDVWLRLDTRLSVSEANGDAFYVDDIELRAPTCDVIGACTAVIADPGATSTRAVCPNTAVTLDGSRSTSSITCTDFDYAWYDGSTLVGTGATTIVYPFAATQYRLDLTCKAPPSCTDSAFVDIPMLPSTSSVVDPNSLRAIGPGGTVDLRWTGSVGEFNLGSTILRQDLRTLYSVAPLNLAPLSSPSYIDSPPPGLIRFYQSFGINDCNGRSVP